MSNILADIDALGLTAQPEAIPAANYKPVNSGGGEAIDQPLNNTLAEIVPDGIRLEDGSKSFVRLGKTRSGQLSTEVALRLTEGSFKGRWIFHRMNIVPYGKGDRIGQNSFAEFLHGAGFNGDLLVAADYGKPLEDIANSGTLFKVGVDVDWYCNPNASDYAGCGMGFKYLKKNSFVKDDGVSYETRVPCPSIDHEAGEAPVLKGRNFITRVG
jgi:hypothetical protein